MPELDHVAEHVLHVQKTHFVAEQVMVLLLYPKGHHINMCQAVTLEMKINFCCTMTQVPL